MYILEWVKTQGYTVRWLSALNVTLHYIILCLFLSLGVFCEDVKAKKTNIALAVSTY